jgi:CubicO group peptidase (beta-lactamase class C family)
VAPVLLEGSCLRLQPDAAAQAAGDAPKLRSRGVETTSTYDDTGATNAFRVIRLRRFLLRIGGTALLLFAAVLGALSAIYSPTYMFRWMVWQDADVGDHARFPVRAIAAAGEPFVFRSAAYPTESEAIVREALQASLPISGHVNEFLVQSGTQAFIVIRDDEVVYERYFSGFKRDSIATSFSVAKSYLSTLVGIAIDEGAIGNADDPITDYLPELIDRDGRFGEITIRHLLDMTSGIRYVETGLPNGDDALTYYFDDLRALAVERTSIDEPPGQRWHYTNYNPLLLGLILERTSGMPVADYLESRIWQRVGTEFDASWSLDRDDGFEKLESGINARPIDFAKLGRLYLAGGAWEGEQVVPAAWVEVSTMPTDAEATDYYPLALSRSFGTISHERFWWRIALADGGHAYSAIGNHGQFIFVAPEQRLIVVRNGERYGIPPLEWLEVFTSLARELE